MLVRTLYHSAKPTLLMSLHPAMATRIQRQEKVLEFRKRFFAHPFQAFVCITGPQGGVGLFLDVDQPEEADVATLIQRGMQVQQDDPVALRQYFGTAERGLALPIRTAATLSLVPRDQLRAKFPGFVAPRAYQFLDKPAKRPLLNDLLTSDVQSSWTRT
ncbi:hypothetical protein DA798_05520 [Lactobacillus sp. PFC-70]|nr:hypothetical protein DA798_05520 [Lactobacillus sp. PFC-70]